MKKTTEFTETAREVKKRKQAKTFTVQVRLSEKQHSCQMCCLKFWDVSAEVTGEPTDGNIYNNGSILAAKPVKCDCCGLKVVH